MLCLPNCVGIVPRVAMLMLRAVLSFKAFQITTIDHRRYQMLVLLLLPALGRVYVLYSWSPYHGIPPRPSLSPTCTCGL